MDNVIRRIFMFVLGVSLGYCTGFQDARRNEHNVIVRMVHRVQGFAESTVSERDQAVEDAIEQ